MRQKGEGDPKDVDVFCLEQSCLLVSFIGRSSQASSHDLLTEQLRGECPQTHDVRDGLRVPSFRKHADRDYVLNFFSRLAFATYRIHLSPQEFSLIFLGELSRPLIAV